MNYLLLVLWVFPRIKEEPPNLFPYRGIYLYPFAAVNFEEYLPHIRNSEINCVVVDFKCAWGYVTYNSRVRFAKIIGAELPIINLENLIERCKEEGIKLVGRIVVFQDKVLAWYDGGRYSIKGLDGEIWVDGHGKYWVDPCLREVWEYNIEIAKDLASRGVPEIQFDYIRFPSPTGDFREYRIRCRNKKEIIAQFLEEAKRELKPLGVKIAGDVYGCVLWIPTLPHEGQSLELMAPFLDVIHPMLYPSHFPSQYEWSEDPREREYNIVLGSVEKGKNLIGEARFVPYIQGFDYRAPGFGPEYIANQIRAVRDSPAWGYIVWHAAGRYEPLWELLEGKGFLTYDRRPKSVQERVREILEIYIRPFVKLEGGDVELIEVKDGVVKIRLSGGCRRSPWDYRVILKQVEGKIKERISEIKEVKGV